eukprot:Skav232660  [mRNA]  locus=scaffold698:72386:78133:+ [translate_table: standard]
MDHGGSRQRGGSQVVLYDCDDFTRKFYMDYLGMDQLEGRIDVSEKPLTHLKLTPPPHNGVGKEEDSLLNCTMIQPKPPKDGAFHAGKWPRCFECKMINGEPEDELRRLVIAFYPADGEMAAFEARPKEFPYADPVQCSKRLLPLADHPEMQSPDGIDPDRLKDLAIEAGIPIVDHEIITLLRIPAESESGQPKVIGPKVLECAGHS